MKIRIKQRYSAFHFCTHTTARLCAVPQPSISDFRRDTARAGETREYKVIMQMRHYFVLHRNQGFSIPVSRDCPGQAGFTYMRAPSSSCCYSFPCVVQSCATYILPKDIMVVLYGRSKHVRDRSTRLNPQHAYLETADSVGYGIARTYS